MSRPLSNGLKYTIAASGALAVTWAAMANSNAALLSQPNVDPRFANAFDSWSVGFGGGFSAFQSRSTINSFDFYDSSLAANLSGANPFASVEVGRDFRFNNAVFGIYGDVHIGDRQANFSSSDLYGATTAGLTLKEGGSVTGRAGLLADQQTLLYGLFGWSWQHYAASVSGFEGSASGSGVVNGPTVGFGTEVLFTNHPNMSFKAEYRFTHLGAPESLSANGGSATMNFGAVDEHALRLMLSFKLGVHPE